MRNDRPPSLPQTLPKNKENTKMILGNAREIDTSSGTPPTHVKEVKEPGEVWKDGAPLLAPRRTQAAESVSGPKGEASRRVNEVTASDVMKLSQLMFPEAFQPRFNQKLISASRNAELQALLRN